MTETKALAPEGTPVTIAGGPYGVMTRMAATVPSIFPTWCEETVSDGDVGVYVGPHPSTPGWHLVHVLTRPDSTELYAPLSEGMFEVAPAATEGEASTTA